MICWKVAHPRTSHPAGHHQLAMSAESRETHVSAHSQVLLPVSTISTCSSSLPNCCCSLTAAASPTCCANLLLQCLHQNDQLAFKYVVSRVSQAAEAGPRYRPGSPGVQVCPIRNPWLELPLEEKPWREFSSRGRFPHRLPTAAWPAHLFCKPRPLDLVMFSSFALVM